MKSPSEIKFGYAAITWREYVQAVKDVSEVGFHGIQLRSPILKDFGDRPTALADLLHQNNLTFVALSGGGPSANKYDDAQEIATQVKHAAFIHAVGGHYLQMTDSADQKIESPMPLTISGSANY